MPLNEVSDHTGPRPKSAPLPAGITKGSWVSRNADTLATVGGTVQQATEWKGTDKTVAVRKAFSAEDEIDNRWSFEVLSINFLVSIFAVTNGIVFVTVTISNTICCSVIVALCMVAGSAGRR